MQITTGLFDHMVLQRDRSDRSDALITGSCDGSGAVQARITLKGKVQRGFNWAKVGVAARGKFTARLKGLAVGGPYDVELRIKSSDSSAQQIAIRDVLVGDVWMLGGQSNMQGCGDRQEADKPHPMVRAFYMNDQWAVAKDPLHNLWNAVDPVHNGNPANKDPGSKGVGPGVSFAKQMHEYTGVPQGLIACAHGGTSMNQWDPQKKKFAGGSLYGASIRRFVKNGSRLAGLVWYQGESDASDTEHAKYTSRMIKLVRSFRRDLKDAKLPFVMVQLGRYAGSGFREMPWNSIQEQQRKLPQVLPRLATVPAIDLELDDLIHIGGKEQVVLGRRLAQAMWTLNRGKGALPPPIDVKHIKLLGKGHTGKAFIEIEYANVVGKLHAKGRPVGFTVASSGLPRPVIFNTRVEGKRVILETNDAPMSFIENVVHYGYSADPVCNIYDEADRPLPVFGPALLMKPTALTGFVRAWRVSDVLPGEGKLQSLKYPGKLKLKSRQFADYFSNVYPDFSAAGGDKLMYFACTLRSQERMKVNMLFGYDGPVKLWLDGKLKFADPSGTNPAIPDDVKIPMTLNKGDHELLIALGSNNANAWGIFARFQRLDVTRRQLQLGTEYYKMPVIEA